MVVFPAPPRGPKLPTSATGAGSNARAPSLLTRRAAHSRAHALFLALMMNADGAIGSDADTIFKGAIDI